MGLFYKTPPDLRPTQEAVMAAAQEIAIRGKGYGTPGFLEEELLPRALDAMHKTRTELLASGREKDLKAFRKHLLGVGGFMDNGPYNKVFAPLVRDNL